MEQKKEVKDLEISITIRSSDLETSELTKLLQVIVTSDNNEEILKDLKLIESTSSGRLISDRILSVVTGKYKL